MTQLTIENLNKNFGNFQALTDINLDVKKGEFVVLVGPSGCGKSTLLRMLAGLEQTTQGNIAINSKNMNDVDAAKRGIAMVFQSYALYPHMSVAANIGLCLKIAGQNKQQVAQKVAAVAETLQISPLLQRKPGELSGGQRQRVAIGRAIIREPDIFLFDEPLSNLDAELRVLMRIELLKLHASLKATMIYVTHDQVEAMTMADRIVVMKDGCIEQVGSPIQLFNAPKNKFVAGFLGTPKMSFLEGKITAIDDTALTMQIGEQSVVLPIVNRLMGYEPNVGDSLSLGIRPSDLSITAKSSSQITAEVSVVEQLGRETLTHLTLASGQSLSIIQAGQDKLAAGSKVTLNLKAEAIYLFAQDGRSVLTYSNET